MGVMSQMRPPAEYSNEERAILVGQTLLRRRLGSPAHQNADTLTIHRKVAHLVETQMMATIRMHRQVMDMVILASGRVPTAITKLVETKKKHILLKRSGSLK